MKRCKLLIIPVMIILFALSTQAARVHRVAPGDNIYKLAEEYGVTLREVVTLNNLDKPGEIYTRQVLIMPDIKQPGAYRVQPGDSLYSISQKIGIPINILAENNNMTDSRYIYNRQLLYIPFRYRYPQYYQVKSGDTLYKIASNFGISIDEIVLFNKLADINIFNGQMLKIPVLKPSPPYTGPVKPDYKKKYPDTLFYQGTTNSKKIALTFDDGPDSYYTWRVMEILKDHNIKATFFIVGHKVETYPDIIDRIVEDGHVIASHSWSHPNLTKINTEEIAAQIKDTEEAVEERTGLKMSLLRPPWGFVSDKVFTVAKEMGYKVVNWNVDSIDWRDQDVDQILINVLPKVREDAILLFHSAGGRHQNLDATINTLPELIETLKMRGYKFVTVDEIINANPYKVL